MPVDYEAIGRIRKSRIWLIGSSRDLGRDNGIDIHIDADIDTGCTRGLMLEEPWA
jgi:hypothetical protein